MTQPASITMRSLNGSEVVLAINAGSEDGKLSTSGKSMVLKSDKVKFAREDGKEVTVQVTMYTAV